ncbi:MAG: class I SAM-dependent methyltransferase [Planctomycetaceae bacterium]|nr:class I SAM-dependent methyltransferase [Planctomycetaceae bacterium]
MTTVAMARKNPSLDISLIRNQLFTMLRQFEHGTVHWNDPWATHSFGNSEELTVSVTVNDPRFYRRVMLEGSLGAAESYLQGEWDCSDLMPLFRILCRNMDRLGSLDSAWSKIGGGLARVGHVLRTNSLTGSRNNIAAHYDLSNDFFRCFLDPTMMYSSAIFEEETQTLHEASVNKLDQICQKLKLQAGDRVIEIGTGWGGLAEHAVRHYDCHVTTTTISKQQHDFARERFRNAGLEDRVTLLQTDYRQLTGSYDKLVSIEMIEAVGHEYLPAYFQKCESLLKPGGTMLIQAILMPDHRYETYRRSVDFIQKYIFPGGHLPSISAIQQALPQNTQLRLTRFDEFADSYALTLRAWRKAFFEHLDRITALGFDDRFIRMWWWYLMAAEVSFTDMGHVLFQMQIARDPAAVPASRDYLYARA